MSKLTGAGYVIFFDNSSRIVKKYENNILYLVLEDNFGKLDFPKGTIEKFESSKEAAIRETLEECGLVYNENFNDFDSIDKVFNNTLNMFLAQYIDKKSGVDNLINLDKNIIILPNPEYNHIIEHVNHFWLSANKIKNNTYSYLKPVVDWADNEIRSRKKMQ
jgi:DNA polymerase